MPFRNGTIIIVAVGWMGMVIPVFNAGSEPPIPDWMAPLPKTDEFQCYQKLGPPFDRWETYHSTFPWRQTAELLLTVIPNGDIPHVNRSRAEEAVSELLKPFRGKNPNAFTCFNFDAAVKGWAMSDRVRLRAGLFAVQKLELLEPMDILLEYSRVQVLDLPPVEMGGIPEVFIFENTTDRIPAANGGRVRQAYPVLQAIAENPERSFPILLRTADDTAVRPPIRFRAACYLAYLNAARLDEINNIEPSDDAAHQLLQSGFVRLKQLKKIDSHWADRIGFELYEMEN